ncbi:MBOAT family O-acyltransferase [Methylomonas koyamae]|uniref:MBOAT family O-acyltransferase n=1 Tax=Methylomonas koyamae TaxID=702114 RepID=UPI000ADAECA5
MPQLRQGIRFDPERMTKGLFLFVAGLCKKTVIADRLAAVVDPLFELSDRLTVCEAWVAAAGYGLQIYFDFSGYCDMASGVGLMFGLVLPQNFASPYQAGTIADFWKRWHITLSRFLRDYLYIPLGGNRQGFYRGLWAAAITMLLGGLWHGAAWTFVAWGAMHGAMIALYRLWTKTGYTMPGYLARTLTLLGVFFAWVLFRARVLTRHYRSGWRCWDSTGYRCRSCSPAGSGPRRFRYRGWSTAWTCSPSASYWPFVCATVMRKHNSTLLPRI